MAILVVAYNIVSGQWWAERKRRALQEKFLKQQKEEEFLRLLQEYLLSRQAQALREICTETGRIVRLPIKTNPEASYGFDGAKFIEWQPDSFGEYHTAMELSSFAKNWVAQYASAHGALDSILFECDRAAEHLVATFISLPASEAEFLKEANAG